MWWAAPWAPAWLGRRAAGCVAGATARAAAGAAVGACGVLAGAGCTRAGSHAHCVIAWVRIQHLQHQAQAPQATHLSGTSCRHTAGGGDRRSSNATVIPSCTAPRARMRQGRLVPGRRQASLAGGTACTHQRPTCSASRAAGTGSNIRISSALNSVMARVLLRAGGCPAACLSGRACLPPPRCRCLPPPPPPPRGLAAHTTTSARPGAAAPHCRAAGLLRMRAWASGCATPSLARAPGGGGRRVRAFEVMKM